MISVRWENSIYLPQLGLYLDPHFPAPAAFVSHAHSDHTGKHEEIFCTPATARLMRARVGSPAGIVHELPFRETMGWNDARITLLPAGHVLGSAQLYLETEAGSLLYTGDFKVREGLSCEAAEFRRAETLVMETTYGKPMYAFPPAAEVLAQILQFCAQTLEDGDTPVLLGYSLGKAQEILALLAGAGMRIYLHPAVWKITQHYREIGVSLPHAEKLEGAPAEAGVVIGPPHVRGGKFLGRIPRRRTAFLSGWALEPGAVHRYECDAAFPLSDHADYPDLLRAVELVAPKKVYTVHGFAAEFARDLRARGIEAWALVGSEQLELAMPIEAVRAVAPPSISPAKAPKNTPRGEFAKFCEVCEQVARQSGRIAKVRTVAEYLQRLTDDELQCVAVWFTGLPFASVDSGALGIGSALVRRALQNATGLSEIVIRQTARRHGETGRAALELLGTRPGSRCPDISEIHSLFVRLRNTTSSIERINLLAEWLQQLSALEVCYVIKLCHGDLRIGLREGLIEEAVAMAFGREPGDVRQAKMLTGDIGTTALLARQNRLPDAALTLFRPISCMLAGVEHDDLSLWSRFSASPDFPGILWAEEKMDGIRAQIHSDGTRAEIFSRDGKCLTPAFSEIAACAARIGHSFVLDGEILAWQGRRPLPFSELQKRLGRTEADLFLSEQIPVRFVAFDCLYHNGVTLLHNPLRERRASLKALPLAEPLSLAKVSHPDSPDALRDAFLQARAAGHEGLVVKDPASAYTPGRRGLAWIKRKVALATLDVVVVAVEYGHGKRAGVLSDYTFAVRDDSGGLAVIGKAYTGLTDTEIEQMTGVFLGLARSQNGRKLEVRPEVVIEVAFDSIRESSRHSSGLALRFPRIVRLRPDKSPKEIDTLATARALLLKHPSNSAPSPPQATA